MAWSFNTKPVATLKGKSSDGDSITLPGITTANITPSQAVAQSNIILDIFGKNLVVDKNLSRVQTEEAVEE